MSSRDTDSPLVIFTHIPRAGGTSMWKIFTSAYGKRRVKRVAGLGREKTSQAIAGLLRDRSHDFDLVGGHVKYGIERNCTDRPCRCFTILRDPTHIQLSQYYKKISPEVMERKARRKSGDFQENLRQLEKKMSGGPEHFLRRTRNVLLRFLVDKNTVDQGNFTREHLEMAKQRLRDDYICFGLLERFPESIELIAGTLGWKKKPSVEHCNAGGNRPGGYDQNLLELGREVNALDYELYAYAEQIFDERLKTLSASQD